MEALGFFLLLALGVCFVLPVIAFARAKDAVERTRRLERRLADLESSQRELLGALRKTQQELDELSGAGAATAAARPSPGSNALGVATADEPLGAAEAAAVVAPEVPATPPSSVSSAPPAVTPKPLPDVVPPASPPSPAPAFDWERWIGVRGAAVLGGVALALSAILFFRYGVEHGLLPPAVRVAIGMLAGLSSLVAAERARARYAVTANGVAGAGLVILYATFWAARVRYDLIGMNVGFGLMALTTAAGCLIAVRSASLLVAVLGLVGGFLTPLLLSSGSDRPLGLFGYLLLLDSGFLLVARRRGWSVLMALALAGTLLIEAAWIVNRMGVERQLLGVGIVALFGLVFVVAGARVPRAGLRTEGGAAGSLGEWSRNQAAGLLLPFGFALYFAGQARFGTQLVPIALLLGLLSLGASWVAARTEGADWLPLSAAVGCVTVVGVWLLRAAPLTQEQCWDAALSSAGLGLVFHVGAELRKSATAAVRAAATAELGLLMVLILAAVVVQDRGEEPLAWLCGWVLLGALLTMLGRFERWGRAMAISATLLGIGLNAFWTRHERHLPAGALNAFFAIQIALALAYLCLSALRRRRADHGAALIFPAASLLGLALSSSPLMAAGPGLALGATSALGAVAIFAATHLGDGRAFVLGTLLLALAQYIATWRSHDLGEARLMLASLLAVVIFITAWPLLRRSRLAHPKWEFHGSALAGPLWFLTLRRFDELALGASVRGLLPMALGGISLTALWYTRRSRTLPAEVRRSALAWYAAVALGFLSVAIPLQLERHWITVGWALQSAAVLLLFRRLDHSGLKWLGVGLGCIVTVRLVLFPDAHADGGSLPFLNWLLYAYGVPALALFAGHVALRDVEVKRLRSWEDGLYQRRDALRDEARPLGAYALGLGVVAIVFAWINLSILDAFAGDARLAFDLARQQTRDLCLSLGWAFYAGALLALGMRKRSKGLRWLSLGLFILTIGKVFLHDLGQLEDLYQVLSLLGLAFSLIAVSLAYQRFVFGKSRGDESV